MDEANDEYVHTVAIKLSRAMNLPVANDLLARNVIAMATSSNNSSGFIQGEWSGWDNPTIFLGVRELTCPSF
jgi:hypothetical protein